MPDNEAVAAEITHDPKFEGAIAAFYSRLLASQESLGSEFAAVLYENLWGLYARS